jgi:hypothetical protein
MDTTRVPKNVNEKSKEVSGKDQYEAMTRLRHEASRLSTFGIKAYDMSVDEGEHGWTGILYYIDTGLGV